MQENKSGVFLDWVRLSCPGMLDQYWNYLDQQIGWLYGLGEKRRLLGYDGNYFMGLGFFGTRFDAVGSPPADDPEGDPDWYLDVLLDLPGELCAQLGGERLTSLCQEMDMHGFAATRLDGAYDVRDERVTVKLIEDMFKRKQVVTGSDKRNAITGSAGIGEPCSLLEGGTLRIGGRQSQMFMKVYDKRQEHLQKTGIDIGHCTRFELEIKADKAKRAFRCICDGEVDHSTGEIMPFNLSSLLKDFICFYKTPKRKKVCDWWQAIDDAPAMVWPEYEHCTSLDSTLHWLRVQVLPTIKALEDFGYGGKLREVLESVKPSRELTAYLKALRSSAAIPV